MTTIYLICNSHIDPIWQWNWEEGVGAAIATFRSVVKLSSEYDFVFCHNESYLYEYVEKYEPQLFGEIRELVKRGKWKIMGGWYLQPDCNLPSGESIFRHIERGRKYFGEKFGVKNTTAVNLDPFGHSKGLVQILNLCGYDSYLIKRPEPELFPAADDLFWWKGFNGSKVKVYRVERYGTLMGHALEHVKYLRKYFEGKDNFIAMIGLGNHGGGLSRRDLTDIACYDANDVKLRYSCPEDFFSEHIPHVCIEESLNHVFPGGYSSLSALKRKHIELENALAVTEGIAVLAEIKHGKRYEEEKIEEAVSDLLINEFHDVLPGTLIKSGENAVISQLEHGIETLNKVFANAFFRIMMEEKAAEEGTYPIFIYNPTPYERGMCAEAEFTLCPSNDDPADDSIIRVFAEDGKELISQSVKEESNLNWDCRQRVAFDCVLKPYSVNRFYATATKTTAQKKHYSALEVRGRVCARVDCKSGRLNGFSADGEEYLDPSGVALTIYEDNPDPWGMAEDQQSGIGSDKKYFNLSETPRGAFKGMRPVQTVEQGDVYTATESFFDYGGNTARIKCIMYRNQPYTDIEADLHFDDADKAIRLEIPLIRGGKYIGQTMFGTQELPRDGKECVSHRFVAVKGSNGKCFAVFNNCTYGSRFEDNKICITLLRGVGYCVHPLKDREIMPENRYVNRADIGEHRYFFRLAVCNTDELGKLADEFNKKPYVINYFPAGKIKAKREPFVEITNHAITLSSLRKRNGEYILRLFNSAEKRITACVKVGGNSARLTFNPFQIRTFRITESGLAEIEW